MHIGLREVGRSVGADDDLGARKRPCSGRYGSSATPTCARLRPSAPWRRRRMHHKHKSQQKINIQLDTAWRSETAGAPVVGGNQKLEGYDASMIAMEQKVVNEANTDAAAAVLNKQLPSSP